MFVDLHELDALAVTLNCADAVVVVVADIVAPLSGTRTPELALDDAAEPDALTGRILTTETEASDEVAETIVCRSALSNTPEPYAPVPYENLSDSFSTNCSATDDVDAVELTTAPERRTLVAVVLFDADAGDVAPESLTRSTEPDEANDPDTTADASLVVPSTPKSPVPKRL